MGLDQPEGREGHGRDLARRTGADRPAPGRGPGAHGLGDRHDLPGSDVEPPPVLSDRRPDRRGDPRPPDRSERPAARAETIDMLRRVGIPAVERRVDAYPHQLSGGMRQRVMIAMALINSPRAADRRRADDGARRHRPGPDPRADLEPAGRVRNDGHPDHPRPRDRRRRRRRRRGDVRRPDRRGRPDRGALRSAPRCPTRSGSSPRSRAWTACCPSGSTRFAATRRRRSTCRRAASSSRAATTPTGSPAEPA